MRDALTPEGLAVTHATAFGGKGWPASDFRDYLANKSALIFGDDTCFAVIRVMVTEAEVLTLATRPGHQGKGRATAMLQEALDHLAQVGVHEVFLEVADNNTAALALYARCGFTAFDERRNYYPDGRTAICMKLGL